VTVYGSPRPADDQGPGDDGSPDDAALFAAGSDAAAVSEVAPDDAAPNASLGTPLGRAAVPGIPLAAKPDYGPPPTFDAAPPLPADADAEPGPTYEVIPAPEPDPAEAPLEWAGDAAPAVRPRALLVAVVAIALVLVGGGAALGSALGGSAAATTWLGGTGGGAVDPSPSPTPAAVPADAVTLSGVGDVIMGSAPNHLPPHGGAGFFDPVKSALASDLVMGNLETPLTDPTGKVKCGTVTPTPSPGNPTPKPVPAPGCYQFSLPPSYADNLRDGGFQLMNLANNHTNDMGPIGLTNTRNALTADGIGYTGAPGQITVVDVKGVRVAVLGFSVYSWTQNLNNISGSAALVRKAKQQADLVVIQMQAGAEGADKAHVKPGHEIFLGEDRGDEIAFTHAMIDAGADVVFGHGPHIMRGMQFYKGKLIAYSLGNFCGYGVLSSSGYQGVGGVLKVTLTRTGGWVGATLVGTQMVHGGMVEPDPKQRAIDFVNGLSQTDFGATAAHIAADGSITPPAS
jgi:hypothetical protein